MTIAIGDRIPEARLSIMGEAGPRNIDSLNLFRGKRMVVFGVPGAFTPTCSARHLPGFLESADAFLERGIDAIVCLAVNDVFVMDAWGKNQGVGDRILMVADGNGDFTRAAGLELDLTARGFGLRSHRYAMIVEDGVVSAMKLEKPGEFLVSDAQTMLGLLDGKR
jgi:peroxiredoxin